MYGNRAIICFALCASLSGVAFTAVDSAPTSGSLSSRVVSAEVRGYVFYADGETPAAGVPVRIWDIETQEFTHEVSTDHNGFYRIPKLDSGRYYLTFDWTKIELVIVETAGGLAQQPHDVIAIIPRGFAPVSITKLSALLITSSLANALFLFDPDEKESIVSP